MTMSQADLFSLSIEKYNLWRDLFAEARSDAGGARKTPAGVYYYGGTKIDRFLSGEWKRQLESLRKELADLKKALPPQYPFLQTIKDSKPIRATFAWRFAATPTIAAMWRRGTCHRFCARARRSLSPRAAAGWNWRRGSPTRPIR